MRTLPLRAPKPFASFSGVEFVSYVRSLRVVRSATASKTVSDIGITFKRDKATLRVKRDPKTVTRDEITKLASEYGKEELYLLCLFRERKIEVLYGDTDIRKQTDDEFVAAERTRKRNAKPRKPAKRKNSSKDQLLELGRPAQLHEESPIHVHQEIKSGE